MIAVTFALPNESSDFRRLLGARGAEIAILHTGVGKKTCQARLAPFLDARPFALLISSGFAGGVEPSLGAGDLLLAENFSDPQLLARAEEILIARVARLATADRIIEGEAERLALARAHDAAAVDMETQWIAAACAERNLPLLSLRAISDTAAAPFPAPPAVLFDMEKQRTDPFRLLRHLLGHPSEVVRLIRFARQIARARENLTAALALLVRELPG